MQFLIIVAAIGLAAVLLGAIPSIPLVTSGVTSAIHGLSSLACAVDWIVPVNQVGAGISLIIGVYGLGLLIRILRWMLDLLPLGGGF